MDASAKCGGDGSKAAPLNTIQAAANLAYPGDVITIADGLYREWVDPPRGGASRQARITYRAAEGARPILTGGEPLTGWQDLGGGIWKLRVPDTFFARFGGFNPFREHIKGDCFHPHGRKHPRAMLIVGDVRSPMTDDSLEALRKAPPKGDALLNVATLTAGEGAPHPAGKVTASEGLQAGEDGLTYIYDGAWARYDGLAAKGTLRLRVASAWRDAWRPLANVP